MTEINITIEELLNTPEKTVRLYKFQGQLDESNIDQKAQIFEQELLSHPKNFFMILDFEFLDYVNSKTIGYLSEWYNRVTENGGKVVITKAKPNILDILEVVGLTQLISFYQTLEEAKIAVLGSPNTNPASGSATAA